MKWLNQKGLSLMEITIALALMGGISMGAMTMMQGATDSINNFEKSNEVDQVERIIAGFLLSRNGCQQMQGLGSNQDFTIRRAVQTYNNVTNKPELSFDRVVYQPGQEVGKIRIESIRVGQIQSLEGIQGSGIAPVELEFMARNKSFSFNINTSKTYKRVLNIPVSLDGGVIDSCNLEKYNIYQQVIDRICADAFGLGLGDIDCLQAITEVEHRIKESICLDVTGSAGNYSRVSGFCNFRRAHANKECASPAQGARGFLANGDLACQNL